MGTPVFAVSVLSALLDHGHEVIGVYTQPDRETGRGKRLAAPPAKGFAVERGLAVFQPASLRRDAGARHQLAALSPDVIVVAAYGLFLPGDTLAMPRLRCLNVHPSLLPKYRGASPVVAAILSGDAVTGVTIMQVDEEMDSGPILAQRETLVGPAESAGDLTARLFEMGSSLLVDVLPRWDRGEIQAQPQDQSQATVTGRLAKGEGEIDWSLPAADIARRVRAHNPWPGSYTYWRGRLFKVIEASAQQPAPGQPSSPGLVVSRPDGIGVVTGEGVLALRRVQLEGRPAVSASDFVLGYPEFAGATLGRQR